MKLKSAIRFVLIISGPLLPACGGGFPTGPEIERSLDEELRSVDGPWTAIPTGAAGSNTIRLSFHITQQPNGELQGSGTMKEANAPRPLPISITGTYNRPTLSLTFLGMVYEERNVNGEFRGDYTSVAGVGTSLRLTAEGYEKIIPMFLQEGIR